MSRKTRNNRKRVKAKAQVVRTEPMATYDAVVDKSRRTAPRSTTKSEDNQLKGTDRRTLIATVRDQRRNFALLAWMIRKHLDFVSRFTFQAKTDDHGLNDEIEALVRDKSTAANFDATGRYNRQHAATLCEGMRVTDGDVVAVKLRSGHLQIIEGDRVCKPSIGSLPNAYRDVKLVNGVEVGPTGRNRRYCICKREGSSYQFERMVDAWNAIQLGYFTRIDQRRGISPLSTAVNTMQDLYEAFDYALIKAKIHAMFGLAIKSELPEGLGLPTDAGDQTETEGEETQSRYGDVKLKHGLILEMETGDTLDTIESKQPSFELQNYSELMIHVAMLALDVPFTFWDSRRSSFSARIGDNLLYAKSAETKQSDLREWHDRWTVWRLGMAIYRDRELRLPGRMALSDVRWEWQSGGIPWTDPTKEIAGDVAAIRAGLTSPQRVCKRHGMDAFEVIDEIAEFMKYAKEKKVELPALYKAIAKKEPTT